MDELIIDSAHGTLCAIHNTIHSRDNLVCAQHRMLKLCPVPRSCSNMEHTKSSCRQRRKTRSSSPSRDHHHAKMVRTVSANDPYRNFCVPHVICRIEKPHDDKHQVVNVEKTFSCPGQMCKSNFTSKSSVRIEQFTRNLQDTDEVVNELKGEIEKVKHQLHHISQQKLGSKSATRAPPPEDDDRELQKLKSENKRLKREVEAKKKLLEKSKSEIAKAKDILNDYEKKVSLLHTQTLNSSKAMKKSKDIFCTCLKEKEHEIGTLKQSNDVLEKSLAEKKVLLNSKEAETKMLNESLDVMKKAFEDTCAKCSMLTETNENFLESIDLLKDQLHSSSFEIGKQKETIELLEKKIGDLNCICKKVISKTKKQKGSFESALKNNEDEQLKMSKQISVLSTKVEEAQKQKTLVDSLRSKCTELEEKLGEYEAFAEKCKALEDECKKEHENLLKSESKFLEEKEEMEGLIEDLTAVVKRNEITLLHMTEINKQQETIIKSQSEALMTKEEELKLIEKESQLFKAKSQQLEEELRNSCSKDACLCISRELNEIKTALETEKDNHLIKEKIIEDQSRTILDLQSQVKEKMSELNRAQEDTKYLEEEIGRINEKLIRKHEELDIEVEEKEGLIEKLRVLECQRNQLSEEINDYEDMLKRFKDTCGDNEKQRRLLNDLQDQILRQKTEWEFQKESIGKEKQKAVCAAKFATQKLLDTVADFQRQVDAQKKVQLMLTKMLHEKDEQLRDVQKKISSINEITLDVAKRGNSSMKELFFQKTFWNSVSHGSTNPSVYSSCSSSSRHRPAECPVKGKCPEECPASCRAAYDGVIEEEPSRDSLRS